MKKEFFCVVVVAFINLFNFINIKGSWFTVLEEYYNNNNKINKWVYVYIIVS